MARSVFHLIVPAVVLALAGVATAQCSGPGCSACSGRDCSTCSDASCSNCSGAGCSACSRFTALHRPFTEESQPDVFYNLYVPGNGGSPAASYPAPYPTPALVGHSYYTYQPLMPHEMLYSHHHTYYQSYNLGMGLNRTKVRWYNTPLRTALHNIQGAMHWSRMPYTAPHTLVTGCAGCPKGY